MYEYNSTTGFRHDRPVCISRSIANGPVLAAGAVLLGPVDITGFPNASFVCESSGGVASAHTYTYQGSPDGTLWVNLGSDAGVADAGVVSRVVAPCAFRYVRVFAQETGVAGPTTATAWITAQH